MLGQRAGGCRLTPWGLDAACGPSVGQLCPGQLELSQMRCLLIALECLYTSVEAALTQLIPSTPEPCVKVPLENNWFRENELL